MIPYQQNGPLIADKIIRTINDLYEIPDDAIVHRIPSTKIDVEPRFWFTRYFRKTHIIDQTSELRGGVWYLTPKDYGTWLDIRARRLSARASAFHD